MTDAQDQPEQVDGSSFTDGKPRIATLNELHTWQAAGKPLRCYMCGDYIEVGEGWRWVFDNGSYPYCSGAYQGNFIVCSACDSPKVRRDWLAHVNYGRRAYWWLFNRE